METPPTRICPRASCAPSDYQPATILNWRPSTMPGVSGIYSCPKCKYHMTPEFFTEGAPMPMPMPKPPTMAFRHLTWEQFRAEMLAAIIKHNERNTKEQLCEDLMDVSKPALVPGNLSAFLEAMLFDYAPIAPCFVDSSDANLRYFFTGTEAILFTVPKL